MKFLVFNAVVAAALVYLITGENGHDTPEAVKEARATIETVTDSLRDTLPSVTPEQSAPQETAVSEQPDQMQQEVEVVPEQPAAPEPELAALPPVEEEIVETLPEHEISEAEAVAASAAGSPALNNTVAEVAEAETPEFMTARDRQRELELLAQDMELMFLTKAGE